MQVEDLIPDENAGMVEIRKLKLGEYFTRRTFGGCYSRRVLVRGPYDSTTRVYMCHHFDDVNHWVYLKPLTKVWTQFDF